MYMAAVKCWEAWIRQSRFEPPYVGCYEFGCWRGSATHGFWCGMGNFNLCVGMINIRLTKTK